MILNEADSETPIVIVVEASFVFVLLHEDMMGDGFLITGSFPTSLYTCTAFAAKLSVNLPFVMVSVLPAAPPTAASFRTKVICPDTDESDGIVTVTAFNALASLFTIMRYLPVLSPFKM